MQILDDPQIHPLGSRNPWSHSSGTVKYADSQRTGRGGAGVGCFCSLFVTCFFNGKQVISNKTHPRHEILGRSGKILLFRWTSSIDRAEHAELEVQNGIMETFQNHHYAKVHVDLDHWQSNGDPSIFISYHLLAVFFLPSRCCLMGFCPGITGCNSEKGRSKPCENHKSAKTHGNPYRLQNPANPQCLP